MKRLTSTIFLLFTLFLVNTSSAQTEIPIERKIQRVFNNENGIYRLPLDREFIRNTIVPEVRLKKEELAPHYPLISDLTSEKTMEMMENWIVEYPTEYELYVNYLQDYIRSFK